MELLINSIIDAKSTCRFNRKRINTWKIHPLSCVKEVKYIGIKKTSKLKISWESVSWESIVFSHTILMLTQVSASGGRTFAFFHQTRLVSHFC